MITKITKKIQTTFKDNKHNGYDDKHKIVIKVTNLPIPKFLEKVVEIISQQNYNITVEMFC